MWNEVDFSLFIFHTCFIIFLIMIYVDNIIITKNVESYINNLIESLGIEFAIKDLR